MQLQKTTPCVLEALGVEFTVASSCMQSVDTKKLSLSLDGRYCFSVASGGLEQTLKVAEKEAACLNSVFHQRCFLAQV